MRLVSIIPTGYIENIELPDHKVTIRADMRPAREHERHYDAPSVDEVAIIFIINQQHGDRDIALRQRCGHQPAAWRQGYCPEAKMWPS